MPNPILPPLLSPTFPCGPSYFHLRTNHDYDDPQQSHPPSPCQREAIHEPVAVVASVVREVAMIAGAVVVALKRASSKSDRRRRTSSI